MCDYILNDYTNGDWEKAFRNPYIVLWWFGIFLCVCGFVLGIIGVFVKGTNFAEYVCFIIKGVH